MTTDPKIESSTTRKYNKVDKQMLQDMAKDFVANDLSINKISKKYQIAKSAVQKISKEGKWMTKRKKFAEKVVEKAIEDTRDRFHRIAGDVSAVFFKQAKYVKRRLSLIEDGMPVPDDLMNMAVRLHELVQRDLMKIKELEKHQHPNTITVESSMPSVVDLQNYVPKNIVPPKELIVEQTPESIQTEKEEVPEVKIEVPPDPLGDY